jgi:hypothetical protein
VPAASPRESLAEAVASAAESQRERRHVEPSYLGAAAQAVAHRVGVDPEGGTGRSSSGCARCWRRSARAGNGDSRATSSGCPWCTRVGRSDL